MVYHKTNFGKQLDSVSPANNKVSKRGLKNGVIHTLKTPFDH